jgi:outer membrane protein, multidrug efflux system
MTRRPVVAAFDSSGTPAASHRERTRHARHWPLTLAFAAVATAFTGCVSLAPEYEQPPLPVPQTFPESGTPSNGANTLSAVQVGWKDYFTDPVLQGLIADALDYNKDLQLAISAWKKPARCTAFAAPTSSRPSAWKPISPARAYPRSSRVTACP